MNPSILQTKLDALLSDAAEQVATIQEAYRSAYGRYWQGLRTHAVIPADGATAAPDLTRKPSDQAESWSTFAFTLPAQTEGALSVDAYQSRKGQGYIVNADVVVNGIRYRRAANFGPESRFERDWTPFKQTKM